jgi:SAM-dependent methyltransferase
MASSDWIAFWDSKHSIYVNARHHAAHCRRVADDMRRYAPATGVMLDYGCGEALSADRVAEATTRLTLCEAAPNVRAMLAGRFSGNSKIAVRKPEDVMSMASQSFDVIVMHSVAQYLGEDELDALIKTFRRLLKPGGLLVLGDVIPRRVSAVRDAFALLRFGAQEGFYWAAVRGLLRTYFSNYWRLRKSLGLARYDEGTMMARLEAGGFKAERAPTNIGHNQARMTFLAHVPSGAVSN